jgi:hypothetical protein
VQRAGSVQRKVFPVFVTQEDCQRIFGFKLRIVGFLVFDLSEQPLERMGADRNPRGGGDLFAQVDKMRIDPFPAASPLQLASIRCRQLFSRR